jgi:hypothetical protein
MGGCVPAENNSGGGREFKCHKHFVAAMAASSRGETGDVRASVGLNEPCFALQGISRLLNRP